jgi:C2H2-type zinc finger
MLKVDADYFQPQKELKRKQHEEKIRKSFELMKKNLNETRKTASSETSANITTVQDNHQCTVCFKYYCSKYVLRNHLKNIHKIHQFDQVGASCDWCGAKFPGKRSLMIHMKAEHERTNDILSQKKFRCYRCGEKFQEKVVLKEHLEHHKTQDKLSCQNDHRNPTPKIRENFQQTFKIFNCKKCSSCFKCKSSLKFHIIHSHKKMKLKKYLKFQDSSCVICKKSFLSSFHLSVHTKSKHSKTRDFKCEICERSFLLKLNLQSHMRAHQLGD